MSSSDILTMISEQEVAFVDLRFTDPRGRAGHLTLDAARVDAALLAAGVPCELAPAAGWGEGGGDDGEPARLLPDPAGAHLDPFTAERTLCLRAGVQAADGSGPHPLDPRATAQRAAAHLRAGGLADGLRLAAAPGFHLFDGLRLWLGAGATGYRLTARDGAWSGPCALDPANTGHRPAAGAGLMAPAPLDSGQDLRSEMLSTLARMGLEVEGHQHARGSTQHRLMLAPGPLLAQADAVMSCKHVVHNLAEAYGRTATFMPVPVAGEAGARMRLRITLEGEAGGGEAGGTAAGATPSVRELQVQWFAEGLRRHAPALAALTNPTTNSYRRAHEGAAGVHPRPGANGGTCIEVAFPDPAANPYLAFPALVMAGLDGIRARTETPEAAPGDAPPAPSTLEAALDALASDHAFLLEGGVFTPAQIAQHIALGRAAAAEIARVPHPAEFALWFSC